MEYIGFELFIGGSFGAKEGGGDNYSSYWKYHNYIWRPNDVKNFAESIVQGLKTNHYEIVEISRCIQRNFVTK